MTETTTSLILRRNIARYAPQFDDMLCRPWTIPGRTVAGDLIAANGEDWYRNPGLPEELESFYLPEVKAEATDLITSTGALGRTFMTWPDPYLKIDKDYVDTGYVIKHELCHVCECALDNMPPVYRDAVLLYLYSDLGEKIDNLDDIIKYESRALNKRALTSDKNAHSLLHFLKCLQLDIDDGLQPGTTFSYGAPEMISEYSYLIQVNYGKYKCHYLRDRYE